MKHVSLPAAMEPKLKDQNRQALIPPRGGRGVLDGRDCSQEVGGVAVSHGLHPYGVLVLASANPATAGPSQSTGLGAQQTSGSLQSGEDPGSSSSSQRVQIVDMGRGQSPPPPHDSPPDPDSDDGLWEFYLATDEGFRQAAYNNDWINRLTSEDSSQ